MKKEGGGGVVDRFFERVMCSHRVAGMVLIWPMYVQMQPLLNPGPVRHDHPK